MPHQGNRLIFLPTCVLTTNLHAYAETPEKETDGLKKGLLLKIHVRNFDNEYFLGLVFGATSILTKQILMCISDLLNQNAEPGRGLVISRHWLKLSSLFAIKYAYGAFFIVKYKLMIT